MKVLISQSAGRNFDVTQQQHLTKAIRESVLKNLDQLVQKNEGTHGIDDYAIKVSDYPKQTSTVGEDAVQLTVTLTLVKKKV